MAGSWIKMSTDLRSHPKVVRMASALKADKLRVVGGLYAVWSLFDAHSLDGSLEGYTFAALDEEIGWKGFSRAMSAVEWMTEEPDGIQLPRYDTHNGASAKRRAQETERKRQSREEADNNGELSPQDVRIDCGQNPVDDTDKKRTREEKRREEEENTRAFGKFWDAYPRKKAKGDAERAWKKLGHVNGLLPTILAALAAQTQSAEWTDDEGRFIPYPASWLNAKRWEDEGGVSSTPVWDR